jgi:Ankyrin repeats (many copies)
VFIVILSFHIRATFKKDPSTFQGHVELARVLLEHSADVNAQDNEKHTTSEWEWQM